MTSRNQHENAAPYATLTVDCGNTTTSAARMVGTQDPAHIILSTPHLLSEKPSDCLQDLIQSLTPLFFTNLDPHTSHPLRVAIVSSVVPELTDSLVLALQHFHLHVLRVDPAQASTWGINLHLSNPRELGEDLFADIASVCLLHPADRPTLVIDCGTATKFILVTHRSFEGLIIAPGIAASAHTLTSNTAQLPDFSISKPAHLLGLNTIECMRSGAYYSGLGMLTGIISRIQQKVHAQYGQSAHVIATGGDSSFYISDSDASAVIDEFNPDFTHQGLAQIASQILSSPEHERTE